MPPQNMPLWNKNSFEMKAIKKQQTQEKSSLPSPIWIKAGHKFPFVKVSPSLVPGRELLQRQLLSPDSYLHDKPY